VASEAGIPAEVALATLAVQQAAAATTPVVAVQQAATRAADSAEVAAAIVEVVAAVLRAGAVVTTRPVLVSMIHAVSSVQENQSFRICLWAIG
jgi:hypothetical protein